MGSTMRPWPRCASAPVMAVLLETDLATVPEHEVVGPGLGGGAVDPHVPAEEARLDAPAHVHDRRAFQHDRVLDLAGPDRHPVADRGEGADVGVFDARAPPDDGGPADDAADDG